MTYRPDGPGSHTSAPGRERDSGCPGRAPRTAASGIALEELAWCTWRGPLACRRWPTSSSVVGRVLFDGASVKRAGRLFRPCSPHPWVSFSRAPPSGVARRTYWHRRDHGLPRHAPRDRLGRDRALRKRRRCPASTRGSVAAAPRRGTRRRSPSDACGSCDSTAVADRLCPCGNSNRQQQGFIDVTRRPGPPHIACVGSSLSRTAVDSKEKPET